VTRSGAAFATMSNMTEEGVVNVRTAACDALLARRMELKMKNNKKLGEVLNRLTVAEPRPRDGRPRDATIPSSVVAARAAAAAAGKGVGVGAGASKGTSGLTVSASSIYAHLFTGAGAGAGGVSVMEEDEDEAAASGRLTYGATGSAPMIRKWLEKDREAAAGGPGVYRTDTSRYYSLRVADWK
jgi:hypothetical protein